MLSTYPDIDKRSMSLSAWRAWVEMPLAQIPVSTYFWSLSAWRAWVEMIIFRMSLSSCPVALRMESVGRNTCKIYDLAKAKPSLSAWRAWVEMISRRMSKWLNMMSLSAWRAWVEIIIGFSDQPLKLSLSAWRAWVEIEIAF